MWAGCVADEAVPAEEEQKRPSLDAGSPLNVRLMASLVPGQRGGADASGLPGAIASLRAAVAASGAVEVAGALAPRVEVARFMEGGAVELTVKVSWSAGVGWLCRFGLVAWPVGLGRVDGLAANWVFLCVGGGLGGQRLVCQAVACAARGLAWLLLFWAV